VDFKLENVLVSLHSLKTMGLGSINLKEWRVTRLFVGVTKGYFVIHLLLWRTKIYTGYSVTLSSSSSSMEFSNILSYSLMLIEWSIAMEYSWSLSMYNILYFLWLYNAFFIILYNILNIAGLDCCQIIILSIYVPSTHA
jgi:hypothetical protein